MQPPVVKTSQLVTNANKQEDRLNAVTWSLKPAMNGAPSRIRVELQDEAKTSLVTFAETYLPTVLGSLELECQTISGKKNTKTYNKNEAYTGLFERLAEALTAVRSEIKRQVDLRAQRIEWVDERKLHVDWAKAVHNEAVAANMSVQEAEGLYQAKLNAQKEAPRKVWLSYLKHTSQPLSPTLWVGTTANTWTFITIPCPIPSPVTMHRTTCNTGAPSSYTLPDNATADAVLDGLFGSVSTFFQYHITMQGLGKKGHMYWDGTGTAEGHPYEQLPQTWRDALTAALASWKGELRTQLTNVISSKGGALKATRDQLGLGG